MLLRLLVVCGLVWGIAHVAFAEEAGITPGVLNEPPQAVSVFKQVVNKLNPSYDSLWLWSDGEFSQGVSAALWTATSHTIPIASLRAGFGTNENLYGGASLDLPGLAKLLPASVRGAADTSPLDTLWSVAGKYARVGVIAGYSWGDHHPIYGMTFGAALSF